MKLSPSIYAADIVHLAPILKELEENQVEMLHIDIMDGHFVKGMAFGQEHLAMLRKHTNIPLDVHLMVKEPERIIDQIAEAGADIITIHQESTVHLRRCLQRIKALGKKAGVVLNPATPLETIKYVLHDIDMVLIMTVNPGEGGQRFLEDMLEKINDTKSFLDGRPIDIEVDGGIDDHWAEKCVEAGATVIVSGSYLFKGNLTDNIKTLRVKVRETEGVLES